MNTKPSLTLALSVSNVKVTASQLFCVKLFFLIPCIVLILSSGLPRSLAAGPVPLSEMHCSYTYTK